jgi:hypothetical protein
MDVGIWVSLITLISVIIGAYIAAMQLKASNETKRAMFFFQVNEKLRSDEGMVEAMHKIDYSDWSYDENFHNKGNGFESKLDRLLSYLSYICYLNKTKNIIDEEFSALQYKLTRVCSFKEIQMYLWNLYHFSKKQNTICSFQHLIEFGMEHNLITKDFIENNHDLFKKRLNF